MTLQGKIFLQAMWNKKIPWDEPLPEQDELKWMKIDKNLREISDCYIPRYIGLEQNTDKPKLQLLVFCDASQYAYAAAVYLRQEADNICTNRLIFSKARLTPNKELSIPRMELLSALIGVRCMNFVEKELKLEIEQKHVWLDSQYVLKWIGSSRTYTNFVQNRLNEIRSTKEIHYHYIASSENPADFPSRSLDTEELRDNRLWWYGPKWILSPTDDWPVWKLSSAEDDSPEQAGNGSKNVLFEAKLVAGEGHMDNQSVPGQVSAPMGIDINRFSSVTKLLRITALADRCYKFTVWSQLFKASLA